MKMTFNQYDELMDKFDKMSEHIYWPTLEQIEMFKKDPNKWLMFSVFLYEKNPAPTTDEEKESKKALSKFINSELELVDEDELEEYLEE